MKVRVGFLLILFVSVCYNQSLVKVENNFQDQGEECEKKTGMLLANLINNTPIPEPYRDDVQKYAFYSGYLNSLGDYDGCLKLNSSIYTLISLNISGQMFIHNGLCYFKECNYTYISNAKSHLVSLFNSFNVTGITEESILVSDPVENKKAILDETRTGFIVVMVILSLLVALHILQYVLKRRKKEGEGHKHSIPMKLISCFDYLDNARKVLSTEKKTEIFKALSVFDGVRALSIGYVIMGHLFFSFLTEGLYNPEALLDFFKDWKLAIIVSGIFAVDVFFYMSGFLFYLGLQKYLNKGIPRVKLIFLSFINRYMRLLPMYLFTIFAWTYIVPYVMVAGPRAPNIEAFRQNFLSCEKSWWQNLLYINNLTNDGMMCVGVAWYLGNDMQFFIISILIFLGFNNRKFVRDIICLTIFLASIIVSFVLTLKNNFPYQGDMSHKYNTTGNFFLDYYAKPYVRITAYMLGLYFSEFFLHTPVYQSTLKANEHNLKKKSVKAAINNNDLESQSSITNNELTSKEKLLHSQSEDHDVKDPIQDSLLFRANNYLIKSDKACFFIFILGLILINFAVFSTLYVNHYELSMLGHGFLNTFNKIFFVGGLGIILHLTFLGKMRFIHSILGFKIFTPIARITYGAYLLHINIQGAFILFFPAMFYFEFSSIFIFSVGFYVVAYVLSFFLSLLIESPTVGILKKFVGGAE